MLLFMVFYLEDSLEKVLQTKKHWQDQKSKSKRTIFSMPFGAMGIIFNLQVL